MMYYWYEHLFILRFRDKVRGRVGFWKRIISKERVEDLSLLEDVREMKENRRENWAILEF